MKYGVPKGSLLEPFRSSCGVINHYSILCHYSNDEMQLYLRIKPTDVSILSLPVQPIYKAHLMSVSEMLISHIGP